MATARSRWAGVSFPAATRGAQNSEKAAVRFCSSRALICSSLEARASVRRPIWASSSVIFSFILSSSFAPSSKAGAGLISSSSAGGGAEMTSISHPATTSSAACLPNFSRMNSRRRRKTPPSVENFWFSHSPNS